MKNIQKATTKIQMRIQLRTTILYIFGGVGLLSVLFILFFIFHNLTNTENSMAAGSISSIKTGSWTDNMTWNLQRKPGNNEEIIIGREELVIINNNVQLENVTLKVYGKLQLLNGKLRLDANSTILVAKEGEIISNESSNSMISFGENNALWIGNQINAINAPSQLTSSGESSVDLLPVHLDYFKGSITNDSHVLLEWETFSEQNNAFFTVEKLINDAEFVVLDKIMGAGNSNSKRKYQFIDENSLSESAYYRLKQTDFNGNVEYFKIVHIVDRNFSTPIKATSLKINKAGPNPFDESFTLSYTASENDKVEINISSIEGKVVHREIIESSKGENKYTFTNARQIDAGLYVVTLSNSGKSEFVKMIKI